ncbi:zinc ribbon domain-containing protein [Bifidobacterium ruminantium]|uniref:zinc ribbon domain-containing protein n=1 Tax=Bifidobacterium ruminantium TaxID=78346 RepID=UPI001C2343A8|nr:zinc ribbon domain-containing protein [Bifidobacterium ruminantium]MBU9111432.1 zinc ribbon domain-containing protein [Bifidobacterium ruminantium]
MARYDFCPHCGTANNGGDFCANCGAPLTAPDAGSPQDMQTVPIPVLTTPQGYLDQDGRPIDLSQMAQDFPPDEPHRRGISKKTITVIAALVVVLIVVSAVCGWMIWSNRQRGSQLAACQSAVSSVKASESKAKSEYETAEKLSKTSEEKLDDASLLADLANALGSQKPIAADDYVCDASDGTARLRVVEEQARKDLTSQKAWLRSVNKASKLVQASIDKQTAKDKADKVAKAKAAKESEEKTKKQSQNSTIETSEYVNARYSYSIQAPSDFVWSSESDNGDGRQFSSDDDDDITITVWGSGNLDGGTPESAMRQYLSDHDVTYHALGDSSFVATWQEDGTITYLRELVDDDIIRAVEITYPSSSSDRGNKVVEAVAPTLKSL